MQAVVCLIFLQLLMHSLSLQNTYKAAVLEYSPRKRENRYQSLSENLREHLYYVEHAASQGVQIIVFPEDGLTGWEIDEKELPELSTEVPDPTDHISPCITYGKYAKFLTDISCAAKKNKIYIVANLIEQVNNNSTNTRIYHNVNIALDRSGAIIAKYRKINLYDEDHFVPGPHVVSTFTTDFGVKFGMFISFDILFKSPSQVILEDPSVTDIVYSVAWFSQLPFLEANSIQHGYAKSNGVNLLAAGMNNPEYGNGGSGIYLADGKIGETFVTGGKVSKLIIYNVPKLRSRKETSNSCQGSSSFPGHPFSEIDLHDISFFKTTETDLSNYTFQSIDFDQSEISETVCTKYKEFCCMFNITIEKHPISGSDYTYKLIAFNGVISGSKTKNIGIQNCGLVACLNESDSSCGGRNQVPPLEITFKSISLKAVFHQKNSYYQPSTLTFDQTPITDYMFCKQTVNEDEEIELITTREHDSLLAFGIIGRMYDFDDKSLGFITNGALINTNCVTVLLGSIFIVSLLFN